MVKLNDGYHLKMVMADVDGTLVNPEKLVTEQARSAVEQLRQAGFKFTIISSRPPYGLRSLAGTLHIDQPMVAFNGGMLFTSTGAVLQKHVIPPDHVGAILEQLQHCKVSARLYSPKQWFIQSKDQPYVERETKTIETEPTLVQDFSPYFDQIIKITGVSDDAEAMQACQNAITNHFGEKLNVLRSEPYYLDITHPLANKGVAVKMIAKCAEIEASEIAVIGDMPSDVPMFQVAGLSIAMGNASGSVKNQATYTTDSNDDEGFAKAMEKYILSKFSSPVKA